MYTTGGQKTYLDVVLVADMITDADNIMASSRRDLEKSNTETIYQLTTAIKESGRTVVHYKSPQELANNASKHLNDIVLSIYGGEISRNRMALVPAICETFNLSFIGPDVYGRIIAQDKEVSKRLALDCGLRTPKWRIIRSPVDMRILKNAKYPCIIKPLLEGSSIGISQSSLVYTPSEAEIIANDLLTDIGPPIMVEEFISGRETSLSVIEQQGNFLWGYSEVVIKGNPVFFENALFDAEEKTNPSPRRTVCNIDNELDPQDLRNIENFLRSFGQFGYCRVDGRHKDGKFYFLELTPDAWIAKRGQFAMAFTEKNWSYSQVINAILTSKE
jgi:D-alanine-D-alanine ligase